MVVTMVNQIPMVQTRFKIKTKQYFGATELPLILASTDLGYLLCLDAHKATHRAGELVLSVTKQTAYIVGAKRMLLSIRRKCTAPGRGPCRSIPDERGPKKKIWPWCRR